MLVRVLMTRTARLADVERKAGEHYLVTDAEASALAALQPPAVSPDFGFVDQVGDATADDVAALAAACFPPPPPETPAEP